VTRNRLTAPDYYLGVRRITCADGRLGFDGDGPLVDAVVEMRRFDQAQLLDALARRGALDAGLMERLAAAIADFHARAEVRRTGGGAANIEGVLEVNEAAYATGEGLDPARIGRLSAAFRAGVETHRARLDARERDGRVRLCHGDLHLRNIFRDGDRPVLFDCLEFNNALATVDVGYDLAFLLMDLRHRGLDGFANLLMNRWLDATGDEDALPVLPYFMAMRAAVRAHVTATQVKESGGDPALAERARSYFELAETLLAPAPLLVAIGGLSGSGKSTVAAALAPHLGGGAGARTLASDRVRKAVFEVAPDTRLPAEAYAPGVSEGVYAELATRAEAAAAGGACVIADAVFSTPGQREAIAAAAARAGAPFLGVWLDLAPEALRARVAARRGGPSDATVAVLERQLGYDLGRIDWLRLDAGPEPDWIAAAILRHLLTRRPEASRP
jgi:aminoglycoside phosphotransferase family enzyme/predicted kinase